MRTLPLHETHVQAGAEFEPYGGWLVPAHFGDPGGEYEAATQHAALFDLSCRTIVQLAGPDARTFLNNLCTNDVKELPIGAGCEAFLLTAKGRVVAHGLIGHFQLADAAALWLDTVPGQAATILGHLDHYLISEQVELADRSADFGVFHVAGPRSEAIVQAASGANVTDLSPLHHVALESCHIRRHAFLGVDGYDLIFPVERGAQLWTALGDAGAVPAGMETRETLRIEAGVPEFGADFDGQRLGMEVGRTPQAISFSKGCYLGQETVVMARDRGHVNRALMGVQATDDGLLPEGARLVRGEEEAGQITSTTYSPSVKRAIGLAYLRRGSQEPGTELLVEPANEGRRVQVVALPFRRGANMAV